MQIKNVALIRQCAQLLYRQFFIVRFVSRTTEHQGLFGTPNREQGDSGVHLSTLGLRANLACHVVEAGSSLSPLANKIKDPPYPFKH
jgi:hypothetical protein